MPDELRRGQSELRRNPAELRRSAGSNQGTGGSENVSKRGNGKVRITTPEEALSFVRSHHTGGEPISWFAKKHFERALNAMGKDDGEYGIFAFLGVMVFPNDLVDKVLRGNDGDPTNDNYNSEDHVSSNAGWQSYRGKVKWRDTSKHWYAFILTNHGNLIYSHWRIFQDSTESVNLNQINNINRVTGVFFGTLRMSMFGTDFGVWYGKQSVRTMYKHLQGFLNRYRQLYGRGNAIQQNMGMSPNMNSAGQVDSVQEQLIKLKGYLKADLISRDEYQRKVNDLLNLRDDQRND